MKNTECGKSVLYRYVYKGITTMMKVIPFVGVDKEQIRTVLKFILENSLELFWFEGRVKFEEKGKLTLLYPHYVYSKAERKETEKEIAQKISKYNLHSCTSDLQLMRTLYNDLTDCLEYDVNAPHGQNLSSVFINNRSVCKGMSKAFQYVLQQNGILCKLVSGSLDGTGLHVWNGVKVNDEWLHIDVALGCRYFRGNQCFKEEIREGDFFCISTEEIAKTHIIYSDFIDREE